MLGDQEDLTKLYNSLWLSYREDLASYLPFYFLYFLSIVPAGTPVFAGTPYAQAPKRV